MDNSFMKKEEHEITILKISTGLIVSTLVEYFGDTFHVNYPLEH